MSSRPRSRWRRLGGRLLFAALLLLVLGLTVYLARRPLLEGLLRRQLAGIVGAAIGGEASIGAIEGSWITSLRLRDVDLRSPGLLREVRDAVIEVRLDPLRLATGDLSGLGRARVRAAAVHLDLGAGGGGTSAATEPAPPPDLGALSRLLPNGAEVEIDALRIDGVAQQVAGRLHVALLPGTDETRRIDVTLPGVSVVASLGTDGVVRAEVAVDDVMRVPRLFTELPVLGGGAAVATAVLQVRPTFACEAELRVDGLTVRDRAVRRLEARARVEDDGLVGTTVDLEAPGLLVHAGEASLRFADVLGSLRGAFGLAIDDLAPYAELLPPAVAGQLPIRGTLRGSADAGVLRLADGSLRTAAATLRVRAGAVHLGRHPTLASDVPIRFRVDVRDAARVPWPEGLPLRPTDGGIDVVVRDRAGVLRADCDADLGFVDATGLTGRLRGRFTVDDPAAPRIDAHADLAGDLLRGTAAKLALHAGIAVNADGVRIDELLLGLDDRADAVRVNLSLPATVDPAQPLRGASGRVAITTLPLPPFARLLPPPLDALIGTVDGTIALADETLRVDLVASAGGLQPLRAGDTAEIEVHAGVAAAGVAIDDVSLVTPAGSVRCSGRVDGAGLLGGGPPEPAQLRPDLDVRVEFADLARLDLGAADLALAGALRGRLEVQGTAAVPDLGADLTFEHVAVAAAGQTFVDGVDLHAAIVQRTLRLDGGRAFVRGEELTFGGEVALLGEPGTGPLALRFGDLVVRDHRGGSVRLDGRTAATADVGDWRAALAGDADLGVSVHDFALEPWLGNAALAGSGAAASAELRWRPAAEPPLDLRLTAEAPRLRLGERDLPARVELAVAGAADALRVSSLRVHAAGNELAGDGRIGLGAAALLADPSPLLDAPLDLELNLPAVDLAALPAMSLGFDDLSGTAAGALHLGGTLRAPDPRLQLDVNGARLRTADGQRLDDISAAIQVTRDAVRIDRLAATRGRGPLRLSGALTAPGPLWQQLREATLDFTIHGEDVLLHRRAGLKVRADLDLTVTGPLADFSVAGDIALHDCKMVARIPLLDWSRTGGRAATAGIAIPGVDLGPGLGGHLDVRITTKEAFAIANNVLDGSFDAQLRLGGPLSQPTIEGTISGPEAQIQLPGVRLRAATLLVQFARDNPRFPSLTVSARGRRHGYDVQAVVRGRYDRPEVILSSDPPLSAEDLVVLVTTGARPESLGGTRGVGSVLGAYLAQELADWIFGSDSTEAKESFLDRFSIETGTEMSKGGTESVVVEFRVLDQLYLQGERDVYEDLNMGVVYRLKFR